MPTNSEMSTTVDTAPTTDKPDHIDRLRLIQEAQIELHETIEQLEQDLGGATKPEDEEPLAVIWGLIYESLRQIRRQIDELRAVEIKGAAEASVLQRVVEVQRVAEALRERGSKADFEDGVTSTKTPGRVE